MTTTSTYIIIAVVVIILIIILAIAASRRSKSGQLQKRFGPEYGRAVQDAGDRSTAERELAQREARVRKFNLAELPAGARDRYSEEWQAVQNRFVDEPKAALAQADQLVTNVMRDRGYPMEDFDQRVVDISPDHPAVVENYRAAHAISTNTENASTEDLRQAMVHYRTLFDDLLGADDRSTTR